jgi:hypothetical protein
MVFKTNMAVVLEVDSCTRSLVCGGGMIISDTTMVDQNVTDEYYSDYRRKLKVPDRERKEKK